MNEDDKKLMTYAQAIFDHCIKQGTVRECNSCIFRGEKTLCIVDMPDLKWDKNVFVRW